MELTLTPRKRKQPRPKKNSEPVEREKLQWPAGRPRTKERQTAKFGAHTNGYGARHSLRYEEALKRLRRELQAMGVSSVTVSSNHDSVREAHDPGVALYFTLEGQQICLACDKWNRIADNIAALAAHVHATRGIERWGVGTVREAFTAYAALPPASNLPQWWDVLGVAPTASKDEVEKAFKTKMLSAHPDRNGGNDAEMAKLNVARDTAIKILDGATA